MIVKMGYTSGMLLLFVRHALTSMTGKKLTGWLPGFSLSGEGKKQADQLSARLSDFPLNAIYSSPLERCVETAEAIAAPHRLQVTEVEGLGEIRYGDWQGKPLKSLYRLKAWQELRARPADFRFPNGETIREAQARAIAEVEQIRKRHRDTDAIAICSHADLIRVMVAGYIGLSLDLYHRISVGPASVSALWMGERGPSLVLLGDTGDLGDIGKRLADSVKGKS